MTQTFNHLAAGDQVALRKRQPSFGNAPVITHEFLTIDKVTATQIVCGTTRFNRTTGKMLGGSTYAYAYAVTEEMKQQNAREVADYQRYFAALKRMNVVEDAVRMRKLTVEQMEAIATAYESTPA